MPIIEEEVVAEDSPTDPEGLHDQVMATPDVINMIQRENQVEESADFGCSQASQQPITDLSSGQPETPGGREHHHMCQMGCGGPHQVVEKPCTGQCKLWNPMPDSDYESGGARSTPTMDRGRPDTAVTYEGCTGETQLQKHEAYWSNYQAMQRAAKVDYHFMGKIREYMKTSGIPCKKYNYCLEQEAQLLSSQNATIFLSEDESELVIINERPVLKNKMKVDIEAQLEKGWTKE